MQCNTAHGGSHERCPTRSCGRLRQCCPRFPGVCGDKDRGRASHIDTASFPFRAAVACTTAEAAATLVFKGRFSARLLCAECLRSSAGSRWLKLDLFPPDCGHISLEQVVIQEQFILQKPLPTKGAGGPVLVCFNGLLPGSWGWTGIRLLLPHVVPSLFQTRSCFPAYHATSASASASQPFPILCFPCATFDSFFRCFFWLRRSPKLEARKNYPRIVGGDLASPATSLARLSSEIIS